MREPTAADRRAAYPYFARITTRWMDNDPYAHVNNVVYYSFFDTAVNVRAPLTRCATETAAG